MSAEVFPWAEIGLASRLGVPRGTLVELRGFLKKGEDWDMVGRSVQWSQEAAQLAAEKTGAILTPPAAGEPTIEMESKEPALVETFAVLRRVLNPHVVVCRGKNGDVNVRVKDNGHFKAGMTLKASQDSNGWTLVGRCPRYMGKW